MRRRDGDSSNETQGFKESMCRVPWHIRQVEESSYTPKFLSIGPYHWNEPRLGSIEHKKRLLFSLLRSSVNQVNLSNQDITPDILHTSIIDLEESARESYYDSFSRISSDDFVQMLVFDGCFIIQLLRLYDQERLDDPIFRTHWMLRAVMEDLLLLENQLPYHVLQKLFDLTSLLHAETSLEKLILKFFGQVAYINQTRPAEHLLGLVHSSYLASVTSQKSSQEQDIQATCSVSPQKLSQEQDIQETCSAIALQRLGLRFRWTPQKNFLNLEYKNGVLCIPGFFINNTFNVVMRNFIAYEQCNKTQKPCFTALAFLLNELIKTSEDVEVLCKENIMCHTLGHDREVVNLVHSLIKMVAFDGNNYLFALIQDLIQFASCNRRKWREALRREYFPSAGQGIAFIGIYLTIVQTTFSILQVFYRRGV